MFKFEKFIFWALFLVDGNKSILDSNWNITHITQIEILPIYNNKTRKLLKFLQLFRTPNSLKILSILKQTMCVCVRITKEKKQETWQDFQNKYTRDVKKNLYQFLGGVWEIGKLYETRKSQRKYNKWNGICSIVFWRGMK